MMADTRCRSLGILVHSMGHLLILRRRNNAIHYSSEAEDESILRLACSGRGKRLAGHLGSDVGQQALPQPDQSVSPGS